MSKDANTKKGSGSKPVETKPKSKRTMEGGGTLKDAVGAILDQRRDGRYIPKEE